VSRGYRQYDSRNKKIHVLVGR
ncbi:hypothetical protein AZZ74_003867, partial [Klebsiella pneumoniae]